MSMRRYTVSIDDRSFVIDVVETAADRFEVSVDGQTFEATLHGDHDLPGSDISPEVPSGEARTAASSIAAPPIAAPPITQAPAIRPAAAPIRRPAAAVGADRAATLTAPMPGVVLEVLVAAGARLKRGDPILVLEAMKMRNTIRSPHDALVVEVAVAAGQPVGPGDPLVRLDACGAILANLPLSPMIGEDGLLSILYAAGIENELFPLILFIGIGAMTDFGPLLENPRMILLGGAGQFGIFGVLLLALVLGFSRAEAASIGIIGAIDGPTSIYVSGLLAPHLLGPITVAAYSYMALVPVIMPPIMRALTSSEERRIRMHPGGRAVSRRSRILFPIAVTLLVGTLVPAATPLVGSLMLGNLMRESRVVERLTGTASNELANIVTLFLGLAIGSTMVGTNFLQPGTLAILGLGIVAFGLDTAAGLVFAKGLNRVSGGTFNPLIGAAGISAFPMAARVVQRVAQEEDFENFPLMHAMGANAAGQVASTVAGGVVLALVTGAAL